MNSRFNCYIIDFCSIVACCVVSLYTVEICQNQRCFCSFKVNSIALFPESLTSAPLNDFQFDFFPSQGNDSHFCIKTSLIQISQTAPLNHNRAIWKSSMLGRSYICLTFYIHFWILITWVFRISLFTSCKRKPNSGCVDADKSLGLSVSSVLH